MSKVNQEPVSKADPLDGRFAPSGFFNITSTAREKVRKKRKRKGLGPSKPKNYPSFTQFIVSGTAAVASKSLFTPLERIKTVLQVQHLNSVDPTMKAKGSFGLLSKIMKEQGISALYRGNMSMIYSITTRMFANIVFYDRFKYKLMPAGDSKYSGFDKFARRTLASLLAGSLTLAISYPFTLCFTINKKQYMIRSEEM